MKSKFQRMKTPYSPYNKKLKGISRALRNKSTFSEVLLWNEIKGGKIKGFKFNRQKPIKNYVVDFYCKKLNFVIEIDGCTHNIKQESDIIRQTSIEALDIKFIRFDDERVKCDMFNVLRELEEFIDKLEMKDAI